MPRKKKTLVLIDAHAVLHRAFHALPSFISPKGEPTGALYGFTSTLLKTVKDFNPDYIAACYDLPEPTFRHVFYKEYKAKRPKMADELGLQIEKSKELLGAFGVPVYEKAGFEADDVLATIVEQIGKQKSIKIIIVTGDLDTLQLINDDVKVYTMKRGIRDSVMYDEKAVKERFGFGPELIPDLKGLMGDPSDNIIGVSGIGEKTAKDLIQKYGSLENIYKKINVLEIKPRILSLLKENKKQAFFSKALAETRRNVPIKFALTESEWNPEFDKSEVIKIFQELGFRNFLNRINQSAEVRLPEGSRTSTDLKKRKLAYWVLDSRRINPAAEEIPAISKLEEEIKKAGLSKIFYEIELPLVGILESMEECGVLLDVDYLKSLSKNYHKKLEKLEEKIWRLAGLEFNINSPKQLGEALFNKMGISSKGIRRTGLGALSTRFSELEKIQDRHEIIKEIFSYRELAKLTSTYIDALPKLVDKKNRLHTSLNQMGTTTGRLSSSEPNLQNIPTRTEFGRAVRKAFVAPEGWGLVSFDYSQIELRAAAALSRDKKLTEAFSEGRDIHTKVASEVFNVHFDKVTAEMRRRAKIINFGIIYGMGINSLKKNLNCSKEEAERFYDEYFNDFKGMAEYVERVKEETREKGYTETFFGRRRYLPEINSGIEFVRKEAERMAINAPVQGTATADIIKIAMIEIDKLLKQKKFKDKVCMILQVHDELLFEIKKDIIKDVIPLVKDKMENIKLSDVPLVVEVFGGSNWGELKKS